ncbi:hypothetical protein BKM20_08220 [Pseudomonas avellanae]|uniref:Uncharacterized protein n=2 Tax=Pseudomonas avellanae TaxID=46257 RepID=A0AAD0E1J8_9PSED|nr:hypothetical protein BKM03_24365 [Pseudomonas avellanae]KWS61730.1 hypothetical protein AL055_27630 [Pseudomonas amygdali pv. morsprunorum]PHN36102.1 hypothetical protein AO261_01265 [Pseudomonas avellanae]POC94875.1 hypothetical protein BKM26_08470 [Pseudomonas avellanae]POD09891.1 hypothetical protein BKM20_08220 [Pseudomonas avellanae]
MIYLASCEEGQRIATLVTMNDALSLERDNMKADVQDYRWKLSALYVLHSHLTNMARSRGLLSIDECNWIDDADYQKAISYIKSYEPRTG